MLPNRGVWQARLLEMRWVCGKREIAWATTDGKLMSRCHEPNLPLALLRPSDREALLNFVRALAREIERADYERLCVREGENARGAVCSIFERPSKGKVD